MHGHEGANEAAGDGAHHSSLHTKGHHESKVLKVSGARTLEASNWRNCAYYDTGNAADDSANLCPMVNVVPPNAARGSGRVERKCRRAGVRGVLEKAGHKQRGGRHLGPRTRESNAH